MSHRIERDFKGHFIGAAYCHFFRTTDVNGWRVSTVGDYRPDGTQEMIGYQRWYETMVFAVGSQICECGCGAPMVEDWNEQGFAGYDTEVDALAGHEAMVEKWAAIPREKS